MQEWYLGYVIRELAWGTVTPETALFSLDFSFSREFQNINIDTAFPWIIAECDYFLFRMQIKLSDYSREAIISNVAHLKSCPKYFVFLSHSIKKLSHQINWTWAF